MNKLKAIIVGAGHRARYYASYAQQHPDKLEIVGVADPNELRRKDVSEDYNLSEDQCFKDAQELALKPKYADFIINGTMDHQHVPTSLSLMEAGYDILLEKPFATNVDEMWKIIEASKKYNRKIMVCHVLRYAPFYIEIRKRILNNEIGEIINIQTGEHVSYHHMAVGFVRGKWKRKDECYSSMLMAKSCHDLDLIAWMKSGIPPRSVSSFGGLMQFKPAKAPNGAGTNCLIDCRIESDCFYSARKHYIDHPDRWKMYVWSNLEHKKNPTLAQKIKSLKDPDNPYGKCVWRSGNDVVDHQSVLIDFEDGSTATHNMIGGTSRPMRKIHIIGTQGEIQGVFEDNRFVINHIDPRPGCEYSEEIVDLNVSGDMTGAFGGHGGGDLRLVEDCMKFIQGGKPSISCTHIEDSVNGHLIGFCADKSMEEKRIIEVN